LTDGTFKTPGGRIGTEERKIFKELMKAANQSPGPCAPYNIERAFKAYCGRTSPKLTIGQKHRKSEAIELRTPGPGAYLKAILSETLGAKSFSIGLKLGSTLNVSDAAHMPGPASYNLDKKFPVLGGTGKFTAPKFSFPRGGHK
jgi:hypothetical protein